jgi:hypothetical protein
MKGERASLLCVTDHFVGFNDMVVSVSHRFTPFYTVPHAAQ